MCCSSRRARTAAYIRHANEHTAQAEIYFLRLNEPCAMTLREGYQGEKTCRREKQKKKGQEECEWSYRCLSPSKNAADFS